MEMMTVLTSGLQSKLAKTMNKKNQIDWEGLRNFNNTGKCFMCWNGIHCENCKNCDGCDESSSNYIQED
jgi:hypothetical protein